MAADDNNGEAQFQQFLAGFKALVARHGYGDLKVIAGSPNKYCYSKSEPKRYKIAEHKLYPLLTVFLQSGLGIYSKRINERRSRNSKGTGGNKWLYPDLVGMEDLRRDWCREIRECVHESDDKEAKLWSFEVKTMIDRSNVRESFFQTVSNSSWANFGYSVAGEIIGMDTLKELQILSGLHGIGFIRLDVENPSESQIIIPAKEKSEVDWDIANRLAKENKDFLSYIEAVCRLYKGERVHRDDWDDWDTNTTSED